MLPAEPCMGGDTLRWSSRCLWTRTFIRVNPGLCADLSVPRIDGQLNTYVDVAIPCPRLLFSRKAPRFVAEKPAECNSNKTIGSMIRQHELSLEW